MKQSTIDLYVAGSTNTKKDGGWSSVLVTNIRGKEVTKRIGGTQANTTPTEMTLVAIITALSKLKHDRTHVVTIHTSVVQVYKALNHYMHDWQQNNWNTKKGSPPQHLALYQWLYQFLSNQSFIARLEVKLINENEVNPHRERAMKASNGYLTLEKASV